MASSTPSSPSAGILAPPAPAWWQGGRVFGALLVLAAFVVYLPVWQAGFLWDDNDNITDSMALRSLEGLWRIWTEPGATQQYYPITHTSFWIEYHLWGINPLGYHLVNVLLHAFDAILVWRVLRALGVPGARLAAAIFLLHPVCVESVAWVTERKNTLSAIFYLGSLLAVVRFWRLGAADSPDAPAPDGARGTQKYYWLALGLYICALWGKTATVPLPAVILLLVWWKYGRLTWRDLAPVLPFFAAGVYLGLITMRVEKSLGPSGMMSQEFNFSFAERVLIAGQAFWFYLGKLLWPHPLVFVYPRWTISPASVIQWLAPLTAVGGLFALWWHRRGWARPALVAAIYFVLLLFPVLGFFNVFYFHFSFVSDHFQYFALLGPIALAAAGLTTGARWLRKKSPRLPVVLNGALLLTCSVMTWRQMTTYADVETLYRTIIAGNPTCWLALNNLGTLLEKRGQSAEAITAYRQALDAEPDYPHAHNNLAMALFDQGHTDEALVHLKRALAANSDYPEAACNLGNVYLKLGREDDAIVQYRRALILRPGFADALYNLGNLLLKHKQVDEAIARYREGLYYLPGNAKFEFALATALLQKGDQDAAVAHFQAGLAVAPGKDDTAQYEDAHYNLGGVLLAQGHAAEAIRHYQLATELVPDDSAAHVSLGDALYLTGQAGEAIAHWEKALALKSRRVLNEGNLAWVLATSPQDKLRNGALAVTLAEQDVKLNKPNPRNLRNLAAAYAETGRFTDAVSIAQGALQVVQADAALSAAFQAQLRRYRANEPYREAGP